MKTISVLLCVLCGGISAFADDWVKSPKNPMLSLGTGDAFDSQNLFAPCVVKDGGKYFMYYAGGPSGPGNGKDFVGYQLGLALSDDGETWTKTGKPLLPHGEQDDFHATPALLRDPSGNLLKIDGVWHMLYCGNRADYINHATSRDGLTWEKDALFYPHVLREGETWLMFYAAYWTQHPKGANSTAIGVAKSSDGIHWIKNPANPVLTPTVGSSHDSVYTSSQSVIRDGDVWRMYYAGRIDKIHKYFSIGGATKRGTLLREEKP